MSHPPSSCVARERRSLWIRTSSAPLPNPLIANKNNARARYSLGDGTTSPTQQQTHAIKQSPKFTWTTSHDYTPLLINMHAPHVPLRAQRACTPGDSAHHDHVLKHDVIFKN
jgi:hypothetical protein